MNNRMKAGVDRSLRLAQAVVIACTYALPLRAEQPPTPAPAPSLKKSDPLAILNDAFRESYKTLRDQIVLPKIGPIIFQIGDNMTLMKGVSLVPGADGTSTVRSDTSITVPAVTSRFHELKAIPHVSLALYAMLIPEVDSKLDEAALAKLREYRVKVVQARASINGRNFRPEQRNRQLRMLNQSLAFIDTTLSKGTVSKDELRRFTGSQREDIQANAYEAAEDQLDTMHKQFQAWLAEMTPEERKRLRVVVAGTHMPRVGSLVMQYFSLALGEPYEGRYEEEEEKNSDFRLIYGELAFAEKDALRLLATHRVDADVGVYFFNDAQRMHRDLLADPAEAIIRKKFGKLRSLAGRPGL